MFISVVRNVQKEITRLNTFVKKILSIIFKYLGESKVLQNFGEVRYNWAALNVFEGVMKVANSPDTPNDTPRICNSGFRPTCMTVEFLETQAKFLKLSGYCTVIN